MTDSNETLRRALVRLVLDYPASLMGHRRLAVLALADSTGGQRPATIGQRIGCSASQARRVLDRLALEGYCTADNGTGATRYRINVEPLLIGQPASRVSAVRKLLAECETKGEPECTS